MEIILSPDANDDLQFWKRSGNVSVQKKIANLIADIAAHPKTGIGKPEELKYDLSENGLVILTGRIALCIKYLKQKFIFCH